MKDQPHNKDLQDLLKSIKTKSSQGLDDFECEAMEGFETLGSEQEAHDLKNQVDKKIQEQLFTPQKKNEKVFWFAAAGLFIVISLSIILILNGNLLLNEKDVALVPEKEIKNLEKEKTLSAPTAEAVEPTAQKVTIAEKSKTATKDAVPTDEDNRVSSRAILKPAETGYGLANENSVAEEKAADANALTDKENTTPSANGSSADVNVSDKLKRAEEKETKNLKADQQTSSPANRELDEVKKDEFRDFKKESNSTEKLSRKKQNASKNKSKDDQSLNTETISTSIAQNNTSNTSGAKDKNEGAGTAQPKSATVQNEPGKSRAEEFDSPSNSIYFAGGEAALSKEIRVKLVEQKINKKFDAILILNENKKIEKVTYLNPYELSPEEKNKITEILKTLSNFNLYIQPNTKGLFEYKVNYRP